MRRFLKHNGLSVVVFGLFLFTLVGHFLSGRLEHNHAAQLHGEPGASYREYLLSGSFAESLFENWESEFLQMGLYVLMTAWLVQRGSAESRKPDDEPEREGDDRDDDPALHRDDPGAPWPVRRGGVVLTLYSHSLTIALLLLFALSFIGHLLGGVNDFNAEEIAHGGHAISAIGYLVSSRFWFESFQNWQSEFLSVLAIVVLSIWLRERGSPESKPVHASHRQTGA